MTILVTGTSGHLGRLVVHALLARDVDPAAVVATARETATITDLADLGVLTRRLDYADPVSAPEAPTGVERVLLVTGSEIGDRVGQHRTVIGAAAAAGVELFAYTSVLRAETSTLALAADHLATERALAASGLPSTVLCHGWYLENYTEQLAPALEHGSLLGAAGAGRVSAASRADYAEAAAAVLTGPVRPGTVLELAGDESVTMAEIAAVVSEVFGTEVRYVDLPAAEYVEALVTQAGLPRPFAELLADNDRGVATGRLEDHSRTLSDLLGRPTTSLRNAVEVALGRRVAAR